MDASETMNMFELNGKQIRVGRAMFPPSQIINDGPETHFERTSAAMVRFRYFLIFLTFFRQSNIITMTMESRKRHSHHQVWQFHALL